MSLTSSVPVLSHTARCPSEDHSSWVCTGLHGGFWQQCTCLHAWERVDTQAPAARCCTAQVRADLRSTARAQAGLAWPCICSPAAHLAVKTRSGSAPTGSQQQRCCKASQRRRMLFARRSQAAVTAAKGAEVQSPCSDRAVRVCTTCGPWSGHQAGAPPPPGVQESAVKHLADAARPRLAGQGVVQPRGPGCRHPGRAAGQQVGRRQGVGSVRQGLGQPAARRPAGDGRPAGGLRPQRGHAAPSFRLLGCLGQRCPWCSSLASSRKAAGGRARKSFAGDRARQRFVQPAPHKCRGDRRHQTLAD